VRAIVRTSGKAGVKFLTLYAFSTENWKRPKTEVSALMQLLEKFLKNEIPELDKNNVRLRAIGRIADLPERCQKQLAASILATEKNTGLTLILALSYSGRAEIIDAIQTLCRKSADKTLRPEDVTEEMVSQSLYTSEYPDPDLLIRTSGEMRISNFMNWQMAYTEIYVTKTLFPDFREDQFHEAVAEYGRRQRRFGGIES